MQVRCDFTDKTVLIAGAGCLAGMALARGFARAGARVIVMDRDEASAMNIAHKDTGRIEPLRLDVMRPKACQILGEIWLDEPVDILLHLQPLREPNRLGAAVQAIPALTRELSAGLVRGDGRVVIVFREAGARAGADERSFVVALGQLATFMNDAAGLDAGGATTNAVRLSARCNGVDCDANMRRAVMFLAGPTGRDIRGALLPVLPRSD